MLDEPDKITPLQIKRKKTYFSVNTSKTPISTKNKNSHQIVYKIISHKNNERPLSTKSKNVNKHIVITQKYYNNLTKAKKNYTSVNSTKNESLKKPNILNNKRKLTKNYFTNIYDINNNNYFVNLYETSTTLPSRFKGRNSVLNKNFNTKTNSRNLYYNPKDIMIHKSNRTTYYENSITDNFNDKDLINSSATIEMMKNYRNKLLKEFMKYLKRFYIVHYKDYFKSFINELKTMKKKKPLKQYVYSKKFQKIPYIKTNIYKKVSVNQPINKRKKINDRIIIKKRNYQNYSNLIDRKIEDNNSIVSKIINNQSNELLDGKIRNIFLDSSFLNEGNRDDDYINNIFYTQNNTSIENNRYDRMKRHRILSSIENIKQNNTNNNNNSREIKINFRIIDKLKQENMKKLSSFHKKIHIRHNYMIFNENNNNNKNKIKSSYNTLSISNLINSFSIISKNDYLYKNNIEGRKKIITLTKNSRFLTSIKEEDEKFSLSIQDSIPGDTILHLKENLYNSQNNQDKWKIKLIINNFCTQKYKKILLSKIKAFTFIYKISRVLKKNDLDNALDNNDNNNNDNNNNTDNNNNDNNNDNNNNVNKK